jgi:predicted nucleotidyltransferase
MNAVIETHQAAIAELCRRYRITRLDLFGSAATGTFDPGRSDFDFVADFSEPAPTVDYADRVLGFADALEALLRRRVDVITAVALRRSRLAPIVAATRQTVYDASQPTAA